MILNEKIFNEAIKEITLDDLKFETNLNNQSMGTILPFILGKLCSVKDSDIKEIIKIWIPIATLIKQIDKIQDNNQDGKIELLTTNTLFYTKAILELKETSDLNIIEFLEPLILSAKTQNYELKAMNQGSLGIEDHLNIMKNKNIFIKILTEYFIKKGENNINKEEINEFLDNLAISVQIMDDIQDIKEDFKEGSYSHILYQLYENTDENININNLYEKINKYNLLNNSLDLFNEHIQKIIEFLEKINNTELVTFFQEQKKEIKIIGKKQIDTCIEETSNEIMYLAYS